MPSEIERWEKGVHRWRRWAEDGEEAWERTWERRLRSLGSGDGGNCRLMPLTRQPLPRETVPGEGKGSDVLSRCKGEFGEGINAGVEI
ncbi:hypothetical protein Hypma_013283 [Hypsizygus marmoreus]|uniref:Uncharacterized protein n=1 Tax=Hypsizygus marmoreus TaxID=39966 RepID=A0A369JLH7_HYPMA|nr:hypothetical protein Hypma_013283 [Hypsizygus marmoreus]